MADDRMHVEPCIFMVGAFPPPVHGMALVNAKVRSVLMDNRANIRSYDLAGRSLNRGALVRFRRLGRVVDSLIRFALDAARVPAGVLYVGLSGGWGQAYEIAFVAIGRTLGFSVYLHHHSFAYLHTPKSLTRLLVWTAGKRAHHIALCNGMASALCRHYGKDLLVRVVSNAALIAPSDAGDLRQREALGSLGYLGNISREKGIFLFMDIVEELHKRGAGVVGRIAGPFEDDKMKAEVQERVAQTECLQYLGPQYGNDKTRFLDAIDVLVFPSRYQNEAEPLTVHEAMARGAPILSLERGCIGEIVPPGAGVVLADDDTVVGRAADVLMEWWRSPETIRSKSAGAVAAYADLRTLHLENFRALCHEMVSGLGARI